MDFNELSAWVPSSVSWGNKTLREIGRDGQIFVKSEGLGDWSYVGQPRTLTPVSDFCLL